MCLPSTSVQFQPQQKLEMNRIATQEVTVSINQSANLGGGKGCHKNIQMSSHPETMETTFKAIFSQGRKVFIVCSASLLGRHVPPGGSAGTPRKGIFKNLAQKSKTEQQ
jgi:hypothetical protein